VDWLVTTLIKTPGHAPADSLAAAAILNQLETPGGIEQVTQQLMKARQRDPQAQLFPEITVSIIGFDYMRAGDMKSADANDNLAEAYLKGEQQDLARQYARKALALLDSHTVPASSWSDTEQQRGEIRRSAQQILKKLSEKQR